MKRIKTFLTFLLCTLMLFSSVACIGNNGDSTNTACAHKAVHRSGKAATCTETGKLEHWICVKCDKYFADENCTNEISKMDVVTTRLDHDLTNHARVEASEYDVGNIEYWT